jgi:sodium/proline symporter
MSAVLVGFLVYLVVVLLVGAYTYRMNQTQEDFLLAGRRLGPFVATFSERASGESAWLLLGLPAAAMTMGLVEVWTALGSVLGIAFAWWVVAPGLRRESVRLGAITIPDLLARRFGEREARTIRVLASLIVLFFYSFYVAAQFNGAGKVLNVTFGINPVTGMLIGGGVIVLYTMVGGFFAVAYTDFVQAMLMLGTLVVLPLVAMVELSSRDIELVPLLQNTGTLASFTGGKTGVAALAAVLGGLSWGFGYSGQPHTLARFMSLDSEESLRRGQRIAVAWAVPAFVGALMIGFTGVALVSSGQLADSEQLMPHLATELLPAWLAGIFISGAIAAMMSTADSQLLVGTSALAEDVLHRTLNIELSPKQLVQLSRLVTVGLGAIAFGLAINSQELILELVSYAWSGLASAFGPALILTLHWPKTTGRGVVLGMLTGAVTTIIWSNLALNEVVSVRVVSFALAAAAVVLGSLSDRRPHPGRSPE